MTQPQFQLYFNVYSFVKTSPVTIRLKFLTILVTLFLLYVCIVHVHTKVVAQTKESTLFVIVVIKRGNCPSSSVKERFLVVHPAANCLHLVFFVLLYMYILTQMLWYSL